MTNKQEMLVELKPCPFCGASLGYDASQETWAHPEDASGCIASVLPIFDSDDAAFWNARPEAESQASLISEAVGALEGCRTAICGYNLHDADDAFATVEIFHKELMRIDKTARDALSQLKGES